MVMTRSAVRTCLTAPRGETMQNIWENSPEILKNFLLYMQTVKNKSEKTVDEYFLDLRTFFRFMLVFKNRADSELEFEKIGKETVDLGSRDAKCTGYEVVIDGDFIADLIDDVRKLREYYRAQQYDKMQQHINELMQKYLVETLTWNATHLSMPTTVQQAYLNAEAFLRLKGISMLLEKGIKTQDQLSAEEAAFIESTIKPRE